MGSPSALTAACVGTVLIDDAAAEIAAAAVAIVDTGAATAATAASGTPLTAKSLADTLIVALGEMTGHMDATAPAILELMLASCNSACRACGCSGHSSGQYKNTLKSSPAGSLPIDGDTAGRVNEGSGGGATKAGLFGGGTTRGFGAGGGALGADAAG